MATIKHAVVYTCILNKKIILGLGQSQPKPIPHGKHTTIFGCIGD